MSLSSSFSQMILVGGEPWDKKEIVKGMRGGEWQKLVKRGGSER